MRIAQIMLARGFGGAERSFVDLTHALVARGHKVLALCERRGQAYPLLQAVPRLQSVAITVWGVWDLLAQWQIKQALHAFQPQVVQAHLARAAALGGAAAKSLGLPTLAKTHNYVDLKYYRAIDRLVPTTNSQYEYLLRSGVPSTRLTRIPNFSLLDPVTTIASHSPNPRPVLVGVGRLVAKKGFDVLLRALAILRAEGVVVELRLAGDGPERSALQALAGTLGLSDQVRFLGWREDVAEVLRGMDLFVLPSRDEPFGIVVLEAMALGIPIIATATAGPLEILDHDTASLVAIDDVRAMAEAIRATLADRAGAVRRAVNAVERFRHAYRAQAVVPQYERLYAELQLPATRSLD